MSPQMGSMKRVALPEAFLRCVAPVDRKKLELGMTAGEFMARGAAKNEKDLQKQIVSYLRMKGIEPIVSAMHKRTTNNVGTPDILFAAHGTIPVHRGAISETHAIAIEVKMPGKPLRPEQAEMLDRMTTKPNGWQFFRVTHLDQVIQILRERGIA